MSDNNSIRWLRLLREQRKDLHAEIDRMRLEYEAKLLMEKKKNDWLSAQLVDAQHRVRLLTYEIERKEETISDLCKQLRGEAKLGRSAEKASDKNENVSDSTGERSGSCTKYDQFVRMCW